MDHKIYNSRSILSVNDFLKSYNVSRSSSNRPYSKAVIGFNGLVSINRLVIVSYVAVKTLYFFIESKHQAMFDLLEGSPGPR